MSETNTIFYKVLLTVGLSVLAAAISTATIVGYAESQSAQEAASKVRVSSADRYKMTAEDRALTQKIRKLIHTDKNLSPYARSIRIVSQNGKVALLGAVRSQQEKINIDGKAIDVAGADNVANELTIALMN